MLLQTLIGLHRISLPQTLSLSLRLLLMSPLVRVKRDVRSMLIRDCCLWWLLVAISDWRMRFGHLIVILAADGRFTVAGDPATGA
jgi:hypothetical protein